MTQISRFFKTLATIKRLDPDNSDTDKEAHATLNTVYGQLLPANPEIIVLVDGAPFKTFRWWCPIDTDIAENDRLIIGTDTYVVSGVNKWNLGGNPHIVAVVNKAV